MSEFIEEVTQAAILEAGARGITFTVIPVVDGVAVEADRQVLAAVIGNLLQNAFKFTRPRTTVTLRVGVTTERVFIEIEDECGGLAAGEVDACSARSSNAAPRPGLGLGLAFSRWGANANNGALTHAICLGRDVCSLWIYREFRRQSSHSSINAGSQPPPWP